MQGKYLNRNREEREFEDAERERLERERLRRLQEEEEEEEEVIEREVLPEPEPVPRFSRKWIITFTVGAIIGLIIGLIWFMKSNSRLIRYLREERHQPPQEFNPADSPFGKLNGPKQGEAVGNEVQPDEVPGAANNE
ncbi:hypothetical protein TRFO_30345 [Tritrichomonas foetus]|uniref:Uncharacterized protein n=1 Tax=Tritrichomonas foetus TaxID=1144522 RepID=A0A1J4JVQ5_9EUKA|nr:hypothetical protein TRFO_30345 [Tritrichomonas foetus]|eukprot:OHT02512.1 hypothetical protein TRFO_30345 [Tritrichomonas foetus]